MQVRRWDGIEDETWYTVDVIAGDMLHLFYDNREQSRRMKCYLKQVRRHGFMSEKVFSIDSVAITIRNFDLPPGMNGMLILDSRLGERSVRRRMGDDPATCRPEDRVACLPEEPRRRRGLESSLCRVWL